MRDPLYFFNSLLMHDREMVEVQARWDKPEWSPEGCRRSAVGRVPDAGAKATSPPYLSQRNQSVRFPYVEAVGPGTLWAPSRYM